MGSGEGRGGDEGTDAVDRELVDRFLVHRDDGAFRDLYRAHTAYVFGLALRLAGGRREDAEDVVQETWLRAARALPGFRWESRLRTWLGGIASNCHREQRRRGRHAEGPSSAEGPAPHRGATLDLETILRELPDGLREVITLHSIEGYTHKEIGELLGIAEGTSKARLFDARRLVRRRLGLPEEGARP